MGRRRSSIPRQFGEGHLFAAANVIEQVAPRLFVDLFERPQRLYALALQNVRRVHNLVRVES